MMFRNNNSKQEIKELKAENIMLKAKYHELLNTATLKTEIIKDLECKLSVIEHKNEETRFYVIEPDLTLAVEMSEDKNVKVEGSDPAIGEALEIITGCVINILKRLDMNSGFYKMKKPMLDLCSSLCDQIVSNILYPNVPETLDSKKTQCEHKFVQLKRDLGRL